MFTLFRRKTAPPAPEKTPANGAPVTGLTAPQSATALLDTPRRQKLLEHIWQRTSLSRPQFDALYLAPLHRYAALVQHFPASESHHHAYPGGMLDHGLETVAYAMKLRQSHLLPLGAPPETQAAQTEVWTAGVAYGALLHDLGKIAVDLHIEQADRSTWHPWHGPLTQPYRLRYRADRQYRLHNAATGLLYNRLLDSTILDWLSTYPELWSALLYLLAGQHEHAGILGELVSRADQASVAQALGGDPSKALSAPKQALQRKLLDGLRYLLKEQLKLNQPQASDGWLTDDALWLVSKTVSDKLRAHLLSHGIDGIPERNTAVFNVLQDHGIALESPSGKAIWKATVASEGGWSHSFTFLKVSPALIWNSDERPASYTGSITVDPVQDDEPPEASAPQKPKRKPATVKPPDKSGEAPPYFALDLDPDEALMDNGPAQPSTPKPSSPPRSQSPSGQHFVDWLHQGIRSHRLIMNDAKALIHTVEHTLYLVSPGLFQRYAQEHPQIASLAKQEKLADWEWIQKQFEQLKLHRKQPNGLNIWTCHITGPRKSRRLHGYLLKDPGDLLGELALNNPYLTIATVEDRNVAHSATRDSPPL